MAMSIREATVKDSPNILEIYTPYIINTAASFETEVPSVSAFALRVESISQTYPYLVCELDREMVGYAYASMHRARSAYRFDVDVSVYVKAGAQGNGVGTALYAQLFSLLSLQNYYTAYAGITLPNERSCHLHKKFGFSEIGIHHNTGYKLGKWHDVLWLEKALRDYSIAPE